MVDSRRIKDKATSLLFMNGEDIDGRVILGANGTRRHRLFGQYLQTGGHERLLEQKRTVDPYLGECRFVLPEESRCISVNFVYRSICIIPEVVDILQVEAVKK